MSLREQFSVIVISEEVAKQNRNAAEQSIPDIEHKIFNRHCISTPYL